MKNDRLMIFRDEEAGGGGGGGDSRGVAVFDKPGDQKQEQQQQQQQVQETPKPTVDAEALAQKFGETLKGVLGERQEPKKELTEEEARQLLKYPVIDDEFIKRFGNIDTQKAAFEDLIKNILTHIHTVSGMTRREMMEEIDGKFKPVNEYVTKAQQKERDADFDKDYPALAKPELKPIISAVRESLKDQTFPNEKEHQKAVAEAVAAVIKVHKPDFKLSDGSSPSKQQKDQPGGGITVTTPGSGGGGGGGGNNAPAKKRGVAIFDS